MGKQGRLGELSYIKREVNYDDMVNMLAKWNTKPFSVRREDYIRKYWEYWHNKRTGVANG